MSLLISESTTERSLRREKNLFFCTFGGKSENLWQARVRFIEMEKPVEIKIEEGLKVFLNLVCLSNMYHQKLSLFTGLVVGCKFLLCQ